MRRVVGKYFLNRLHFVENFRLVSILQLYAC